MDLGAAGLHEQPFRTHGRPLVFVAYTGQEAAFSYLEKAYSHPFGLGLFQGPPLSGKTTLLRQFAEKNPVKAAVAVVDGADLTITGLLQKTLGQYGYELDASSANELLNMLKVFVQQQTASGQPPLLIVENTHEMAPDTLGILCELAKLRVKQHFALRLVLASDQSLRTIIDAPAMEAIARRLIEPFTLRPLLPDETRNYVHAKMRAGGCQTPESVLPNDVCRELHDAAGGWPGIVDRLAILALSKAKFAPIRPEEVERPDLPNFTEIEITDEFPQVDAEFVTPKLILTLDGETLGEVELTRHRVLVGRSQHNDICIDSTYISRHHALFVRLGPQTLLMDLNSKNGTYVNSRLISNATLVHNDIISLGHHRIKFIDPAATERTPVDGDSFSDTSMMKDLSDLRKQIAKETTTPISGESTGDRKH
ncbi:MAG: FHA domain-containing protein [Woeseiaceae bacterium]|nr:FHA domain-containing protein [Woeseiaceae bacterium]